MCHPNLIHLIHFIGHRRSFPSSLRVRVDSRYNDCGVDSASFPFGMRWQQDHTPNQGRDRLTYSSNACTGISHEKSSLTGSAEKDNPHHFRQRQISSPPKVGAREVFGDCLRPKSLPPATKGMKWREASAMASHLPCARGG